MGPGLRTGAFLFVLWCGIHVKAYGVLHVRDTDPLREEVTTMATKTVPAPKPLRDEVLTIPEIAWLTNSKRSTVERWRIRNRDTDKPSRAETFPEPDDYAGSNPVWRTARVLIWLEINRPTLDVRTLDEWRKHKAAGGFRRKPELI